MRQVQVMVLFLRGALGGTDGLWTDGVQLWSGGAVLARRQARDGSIHFPPAQTGERQQIARHRALLQDLLEARQVLNNGCERTGDGDAGRGRDAEDSRTRDPP